MCGELCVRTHARASNVVREAEGGELDVAWPSTMRVEAALARTTAVQTGRGMAQ